MRLRYANDSAPVRQDLALLPNLVMVALAATSLLANGGLTGGWTLARIGAPAILAGVGVVRGARHRLPPLIELASSAVDNIRGWLRRRVPTVVPA